jgi:hypothetical protein
MSPFSTAEKIETVVGCYLQDRVAFGSLGALVEFEPNRYRVTADGKTFIVRSTAHGWEVRFKGFAGLDVELIEAARLALDGGSRRDVSSMADALG